MMKKRGVMVFVSMALLLLGVTSCASTSQSTLKLDLSTLDPSQPIEVAVIVLRVEEARVEFYQQYGEGLKNTSDTMSQADNDKLLQILCGTAAENWERIVEHTKAKTGLVLNDDMLMQALEAGDSHIIHTEVWEAIGGRPGYAYFWGAGSEAVEAITDPEAPMAIITLNYDLNAKKILVNRVTIETADVDMFDNRTNIRQAQITGYSTKEFWSSYFGSSLSSFSNSLQK
jgi:hypothetical protein